MPRDIPSERSSPDVAAINRTFYDAFWQKARLQSPNGFNTWPLISECVACAPARLELGPGLCPRLPIAGTHLVDMSPVVVERLAARGGIAFTGDIGTLPFREGAFDLVCAFDVIEHVEDDHRVFRDVSRVLKDDGVLVFSVPLHPSRWTEFDRLVGHARRYEPSDLLAIMSGSQLQLERSAAFGMQPANPRLVSHGMWWLEHHRARAMFWYNWVGMPLARRFQKRLRLVNGLIDLTNVDELVLVCRRRRREAV
jgi:SAM-dependent methyltransferase